MATAPPTGGQGGSGRVDGGKGDGGQGAQVGVGQLVDGQPGEKVSRQQNAIAAVTAGNASLVPATATAPENEPIALSAPVARLPVQLDVTIPIRNFRVRALLALEPGQLVESQWAGESDVPLVAGAVQLAWSEFEVVDTQLAVRLTRLA